jgi:hypothetical protein
MIAENPKRLQLSAEFFRQSLRTSQTDPEDVPDWLHNKFVEIGDASTDGSRRMIVSPGSELEETAKLAHDVVNPSELVSRTTPMIQAAVSSLTNQDPWTQEPMFDDIEHGIVAPNKAYQWSAAPTWLKALVGYTEATKDSEATVNPRLAFLLGKTPVSRFLQISEHIYESENPEKLDYSTLARTLLGAGLYRYDPSTGKYYENQRRLVEMETLLHNVGAMRFYQGRIDVNKHDNDYSKSGRHRRK